jgi:hypothetical protein
MEWYRMSLIEIARIIIFIGIVFIAIGGFILLVIRLGISPGNLPGDIRFEIENISCVFALGTSVFLSILLTLGINLIIRLLNR